MRTRIFEGENVYELIISYSYHSRFKDRENQSVSSPGKMYSDLEKYSLPPKVITRRYLHIFSQSVLSLWTLMLSLLCVALALCLGYVSYW